MKLRIIKIGRPAFREIETMVDNYVTRISAFADLEKLIWKEGDTSSSQELTAEKIIKMKSPGTLLVLLDERGKQFVSRDFAKQLKKWQEDPGVKQLVFIVGGPYGFSKKVKEQASLLWSLSSATLQGDLAWLVVTEQIYRAFTILRGMPYHHD